MHLAVKHSNPRHLEIDCISRRSPAQTGVLLRWSRNDAAYHIVTRSAEQLPPRRGRGRRTRGGKKKGRKILGEMRKKTQKKNGATSLGLEPRIFARQDDRKATPYH